MTYWSKAFAPEYLSNWVLALIGFFGIVFAILTLWLLIRQTRATEVAAQAANLNAQAVINSERAWILLESLEAAHEHATERAISFKNHGRTPAWFTEIGVAYVYTDSEISARLDWDELSMVPYKEVIVPEESTSKFLAQLDLHEYVAKETGPHESDAKWLVHIYGVARYCDIFQQRRETRFCRTFHRSGDGQGEWRLSGSPEANRNT